MPRSPPAAVRLRSAVIVIESLLSMAEHRHVTLPRLCWHGGRGDSGRCQHVPAAERPRLCFARGAGAYLWDLDGRRYVDYHAAYGAIFLGHSHPAVTERVAGDRWRPVLFGVGVTEAEVALARKIVEHVPSAEQVVVCNRGSEATYHAIRLARGVTAASGSSSSRAVTTAFTTTCCATCSAAGARRPARPAVEPACSRRRSTRRWSVASTTSTTSSDARRHADQVAAIIVEPVAHNSPGIAAARRGSSRACARCATASGALLSSTRSSPASATASAATRRICGVMPDLTTMGKAIANGFPLAAIGGRREHMERFNTTAAGDVHFGGTYNGNAVAVEAGARDDRAARGRPRARARLRARRADARRAARRSRRGRACQPSSAGSGRCSSCASWTARCETYEDVLRNDDALFVRYRRELIKRGVFEMPESLGRSHIGASHTADDIDTALDAAREALRAALA